MMLSRRVFASTLLSFSLLAACGGGSTSVLHARSKPTGEGPARVDLLNSSGETIQRVFIASTEDVDKAKAAGVSPGSAEDQALWGEDHLGNAGITEGQTFKGIELPAGRFDFLFVDAEGREQLVKGLRLNAGTRYVLEVGSAWRMGR
jgi:hypothetical protein